MDVGRQGLGVRKGGGGGGGERQRWGCRAGFGCLLLQPALLVLWRAWATLGS